MQNLLTGWDVTGEVIIELTGEEAEAADGFENVAAVFLTRLDVCELLPMEVDAAVAVPGEEFVMPVMVCELPLTEVGAALAVPAEEVCIIVPVFVEGIAEETELTDALFVAVLADMALDWVAEEEDTGFVFEELIEVPIDPLEDMMIAVEGLEIDGVETDGESEVPKELAIVDTDDKTELGATEDDIAVDGAFDDILVASMDVGAPVLSPVVSVAASVENMIREINRRKTFRTRELSMISGHCELRPLVCAVE